MTTEHSLNGPPYLKMVVLYEPSKSRHGLFQCEPMDDAMKVMAEEEPELSEVQFLRVEAEERSDISMEFQVAAVPTFLFFRSGEKKGSSKL